MRLRTHKGFIKSICVLCTVALQLNAFAGWLDDAKLWCAEKWEETKQVTSEKWEKTKNWCVEHEEEIVGAIAIAAAIYAGQQCYSSSPDTPKRSSGYTYGKNRRSTEEARIYRDAGLVETKVNGRPCLINPNIDMDTETDAFGRTNRKRMSAGLAPLDKSGKPIELHHIGQHPDSPLAELTKEQHRGKNNYSVLHDTKKGSEIDRQVFDGERADHWKTRAEWED